MKNTKKIIILLFCLYFISCNLISCLLGPDKELKNLLYSKNSRWKASEIDMIMFFSDDYGVSSYTIDHGLGYYTYTDERKPQKCYFNGRLTWDDSEYYLCAILSPESSYLIHASVYSNNFENSFIGSARFHVKKVYDENSFVVEFARSSCLNLPSKMEIHFNRIIEE